MMVGGECEGGREGGRKESMREGKEEVRKRGEIKGGARTESEGEKHVPWLTLQSPSLSFLLRTCLYIWYPRAADLDEGRVKTRTLLNRNTCSFCSVCGVCNNIHG